MMKHVVWSILLLVPAVLVVGYLVGLSGDKVQAVAAPPLSLEGYLDEKLPEATEGDAEMNVDNFACHVCHGNYDGEELVARHGKEGIGCVDCHGQSFDHRNDEDNITPPDVMYALDDVDQMCSECHGVHDAPAKDVVKRWQERCPEKTDPKQIVCTDCHFEHRLRFRIVSWNEKTGELLVEKSEKKE